MAEAIVSFGLHKLLELLSHESELLNGIDVEVDGLKRQLRGLQSLLKDADTKKHGSERVRNFLEDVKEIVYDAEDLIESFLLKESRGNAKGVKNRVRRLAFFLVERRKFASDIEGITKRISLVVSGMQSLGIQQIIDGGCSLSLQETQREQREIRQTFANNSETDLVGMEQSVEELVAHLVDNNNIGLVSISGMGGIGKTTLARQVFHNDTVRRHFDGFAWVCISQHFTQRMIWQRIFKELRPDEVDILQMDHEYTLQGKLFLLFETGKYLVVLDDIWREDDWDRIKAVFPKKTGCKMLLTSRNEGVGLHADPTCIALKPRTLTLEESWKLCMRIITSSREETECRVEEEQQALGKKMITYCGGLPLAVKVLGGLLAKKHTFLEWKRVYDTIGTQVIGKSGLDNNKLNSVYQVLSLSYEDLSMQLKHCFLYLAHFPEDYKIDVEIGITTSFLDLATIRDSGEDYLEELVRRNMVTIGRGYMFSRNKYCQMHDMMREVCLSKAKEENFLQIVKVPTSTSTIDAQSPSRSRRLVLHDGNAFHMLGNKSNKKVRSLLGFVEKEFWKHTTAQGFRSLPLLRVLDLSYVHFEGRKIPSTIGELVHLRFLSLYNAGVSCLPSSLQNLKLHLHLNLCVIGESVHVPNVLKEMVNLRYLSLPYSMHDETKLELGNLVNLETLRYFSTKHSNVMDLLYMTKLTELYLYFGDGYTSETLCSSLEVLSLHELRENQVASHRRETGLDFIHLKEFVQLKEIKLNIDIPRFPHQYQFPPYLAHISLVNCNMEEDPMQVLEKLFHLKSVYLTFDVFVGKRMVCSKGGFPQLCALRLHLQTKLEEWIVEEGSMPCLHTLTLNECRKLKELSNGLRYITSLQELAIVRMKKDWREKLVPGGEDYYKVQHIPSVQFTNCDE